MKQSARFAPDWISPPGDTIRLRMDQLAITTKALSAKLHRQEAFVERILCGDAPVSQTLALGLARHLGASVAFWTTRQDQYQKALRARGVADAARKSDDAWARQFPLQDMLRYQWLPNDSDRSISSKILAFFGVSDVSAWQRTYAADLSRIRFRTPSSYVSDSMAVTAWLRQGEIEASRISCAEWQPALFRHRLSEIRALSLRRNPANFVHRLQALCAECGVALTIVPAPQGCRASGATRMLSTTKAHLLLSFRYRSEDQFWFSFFHEAGHLLLHNQNDFHLEIDNPIFEEEELEANEFASNFLVPRNEILKLANSDLTAKYLIRSSVRIGVSPGIIVGQLQHIGAIPYSKYNNLKRRFDWPSWYQPRKSR